jgi:D-alanyl-D-alanine carboxypeptidase/D-alanyl-D-alanine-endopeptidase (penicillin-binding protein 4)
MPGTGAMLGLLVLLTCAKAGETLYYAMPVAEIDRDIRQVAGRTLSNAEKMVYYSERFLGAPYLLVCEGEGENGRYETEPLLNLKQINCMTYCEIVIAMTLSRDYEEMFNVLQQIRYRNGYISMATRNHYTMVDWLPANSWCLEEVTRQVGGSDIVESTRTICHGNFFKRKGIEDLPAVLPDRAVTAAYIPLDKLVRHEEALKSGDVVALIQDKPDIFSAHMLLVIKKDGRTWFRHASMSAGKVLDEPFAEYLGKISKKPVYQGMSFMRIKEAVDWSLPGARRGQNPLVK